jgi:hypothetical protein
VKKILFGLALCLLTAPLAVVATFLLTPLWRWLEATTAIESIGHSGPSDWCFVAVYSFTLVASFSGWRLWHSRAARGEK